MARTPTFWAAVNSQFSAETFVLLMEMWGGGLAERVCLANNTQDVVSGGVTYVGFPFKWSLAARAGQVITVQCEVQNVDRAIWSQIETITGRPRLRYTLVALSEPDAVIWRQHLLRAAKATVTDTTVSLQVAALDTGTEPAYGGLRATPDVLPGMALISGVN